MPIVEKTHMNCLYSDNANFFRHPLNNICLLKYMQECLFHNSKYQRKHQGCFPYIDYANYVHHLLNIQ